jgi:DNA-binding MarR family transcriptional regulator
MSRIVASLERTGLVRRRATEDARRVRLEATAKGTKVLQEGRKRRVESLAHALSSLPDKELLLLSKLIVLLQELIRNLSPLSRR